MQIKKYLAVLKETFIGIFFFF